MRNPQIQCFDFFGRTPVDGFFPDFLRAQNMVRIIEGKIIYGDGMMEIQGKSILVRVSEGSSCRESTVYQNPE